MKNILKIALTFSGIVTGSEIIDEKLAKNFLRKKRANSYRGEEGTAISIDDRTVLILNSVIFNQNLYFLLLIKF